MSIAKSPPATEKTASIESHQRSINCSSDPIASLTEMFVGMVQAGRIAKGQCPALRPVFLKPHGIARGVFRVLPDLAEHLRVGLFAGTEYPAWVRFSSDTLLTIGDYKTTLGVGIKLFGVPGRRIFGRPDDTTFDLILQNFDVFFVSTATDMCEFTQAGVVNGDYAPYLTAHPDTARLLDEMAQPVGSVLGTSYWSGVPFTFGAGQFVKYKLEPVIDIPIPSCEPPDPTYLALDFEGRLQATEAKFRFLIQFQTDEASMPLDNAIVRWTSPFTHVADLVLPRQNIRHRGQSQYGENLSFNIWRVTEPHTPQGSLALARRAVYAASAKQRRDVNGVPTGEPDEARTEVGDPPIVDSRIVRAAIHPAIGVARVGDSTSEFYIGPEVTHPPIAPVGFYRDGTGALKREVARFHLYGYNASGQVVRELTSGNANVRWTVHLANRKASWYQFQAALDISDAASMKVPLRNPKVQGKERGSLIIDPGPRSIAGANQSGVPEYCLDTGTFMGKTVLLGEIQTDESGCLLVFGGHGKSASPSGAPIFDPSNPNSFNNADDWFDDISDGPVTATVSIDGRDIPVESAWVTVAPPNYAPDIIGWRTLYDLLIDVFTECGWLQMPQTVSFTEHILPVLSRLSSLQWVNKGFAAMFGKGSPMDFGNPDFVAKLAKTPDRGTGADPYAELRLTIFNGFRPANVTTNEPFSYEPRLWPWIYGDAYGSFKDDSPANNLPLPSVQRKLMERWAAGDFINDWQPGSTFPQMLGQVPLAQQPEMLDKAPLHFCLADAFHPGCEMTWPMRHSSLYQRPFRIRHRPQGQSESDYGASLDQQVALQPGGPLYEQGPGTISRWMALPWQGDTAFCRSGYEPAYDPYVPTFWPARVPNQVLTEEDYEIVIDKTRSREERVAAFHRRAHWIRALKGSAPKVMLDMVAHFSAMGIIEARRGVPNDPDFPETIYVESLAGSHLKAMALEVAHLAARENRRETLLEQAGWDSQEQLEEFRNIRIRFKE